MAMFDHYRVNVAVSTGPGWDGKPSYSHLFATDPGSIRSEGDLKRVMADLAPKFPAPAYKVDVTCYETRGQAVTL